MPCKNGTSSLTDHTAGGYGGVPPETREKPMLMDNHDDYDQIREAV